MGSWKRLLAAAAVPIAGFALLLVVPSADVRWEDHPTHFWLVVAAAGASAVFAYATGDDAEHRGDARLFLISLAFLSSGGFLALHALATPGVLLSGPNAGFVLATPVGLLVAAGFGALSAREDEWEAALGRARRLRLGLLLLMLLWGVASLAEVGPLDDPTPTESGSGALIALALPALALYGYAGWRYLSMYARRESGLLLAVAAAMILLAEACVAVTFSRNWHATWWEWHLLMLAAFVLVVARARREWREERFSDLYLDRTALGKREVSVLFADLAGFTAFAEGRDPREVSEVLNAYFSVAIPPVVEGEGGEIDRVMGDAIMASFNRRDDQPDHARRAARAAVALRDATEALARENPGWPRFRIGVNTGEAMTGVVGTAGGRSYTVIGDAVNVAARLEQAAPVGQIAISAETLAHLGSPPTERLGRLEVKGRAAEVETFLLTSDV